MLIAIALYCIWLQWSHHKAYHTLSCWGHFSTHADSASKTRKVWFCSCYTAGKPLVRTFCRFVAPWSCISDILEYPYPWSGSFWQSFSQTPQSLHLTKQPSVEHLCSPIPCCSKLGAGPGWCTDTEIEIDLRPRGCDKIQSEILELRREICTMEQ